jgi:hypothetical protein
MLWRIENERAGGMAQVVEHLPRIHKALSSNPTTAKENQRQKQKLRIGYLC